MSYRLINGDCIEVMRGAQAESVHAVVCDPPYGLEFMGKTWDSPAKMLGQATGVSGGFNNVPAGVHRPDMAKCDGELFGQWCEAWALEALRVLKPGGHILAFGGTRMWHWLAVGIERAGFEVRESIAWIYGEGMPKAKKLKDHEGWKTACLKPAVEPIVVARKALSQPGVRPGTTKKATTAQNMSVHGVGGFNIAACLVGDEQMVNPPGMAGWNAYRHEGAYQDTDEADATVSEGRFPANVMLDDAAAAVLESQAPGASKFFHVSPSVFDDAPFMYCPKPSQAERHAGLEGVKNPHITIKPITLMRELVRLVAPPGAQILDPFCGSGTTGIAALLEGMKFIGIEIDPDYLEAARLRIEHWTGAAA